MNWLLFSVLTAFVVVAAGEPSLAEPPLDKRISVPSEEQTLRIEIKDLESRIHEKDNDADAWAKLAPAYFKSGDFEKAAGAYRKVIELKGESEEALLGVSEALIFGNNGDVTKAAKEALNAALVKNPKSGRGRLWLAIAAEQEGKKEEAQKAYRDMLNEDLSASVRRMATEQLANLTITLKQAESAHGAPHGSSSGPAPKGHMGDIPEMVERLAERLKTGGGTVENWLMLIRSYHVLKEDAKEAEAIATAKQKFASEPHALAAIDALIAQLKSPEAEPTEAKGEEEAAGIQTSGHGPAVRDMVARLADKLKDKSGDLEEWLQLIRSYSVLKENDKAREAAATARQKFASDAKALEQIEALLQEVKLSPKT